jgi:hypothetical protein
MLWSQYKLATIRRTEFLRKEITGIPNIANWNSDFLTLQTSEFQKKNPTRILGIENGIRIQLTMMGVPEIGTKNWNSQPSATITTTTNTLALALALALATATTTALTISLATTLPTALATANASANALANTTATVTATATAHHHRHQECH